MNKVISVNLGGNAYQLEEGGYDALRVYLETAAARLQNNPDRDEILSDIERAIAEKFRALLGSHKTVIEMKEVAAVLRDMGPVDVEPGAPPGPGASGAGPSAGTNNQTAAGEQRATWSGGTPKRLYRIPEGAMIAGVCNGLAAYFNIDPTFVRLAFVLVFFLWGTGLLVYVVMAIVVPNAVSPEQKAAATGSPATAQEFIRRAKEGYYDAMKHFPDRAARREWRRRFREEMRAHAGQWRYNWHSYWAQPSYHPVMGFALPLLSLFQAAATILLVCALISLLATGTLFGEVLSASVPIWLTALGLLFVYGIIVGPLKMARRSCYWGLGQSHWAWSFAFFSDALIWIAVVAVLFWLAMHYSSELHTAVRSIPSVVHQAASDIQTWWKRK